MKDENRFLDKHEARELAIETLYALDFNDQILNSPDLTNLPGKNEAEMKELSEEVLFYARYLITGVLSHIEEIDNMISKYPFFNPDSIRAVLDGTYEIGRDSLKHGLNFYKLSLND